MNITEPVPTWKYVEDAKKFDPKAVYEKLCRIANGQRPVTTYKSGQSGHHIHWGGYSNENPSWWRGFAPKSVDALTDSDTPWIVLIDLSYLPITDRQITMMVDWCKTLAPFLKTQNMHLCTPRVSGYRFEVGSEIQKETEICLWAADNKSLGGESKVNFRDVTLLEGCKERERSLHGWARSFSTESMLVLAMMTDAEIGGRVEKVLSEEEKKTLDSLIEQASFQFLFDMVYGGFDPHITFPGLSALLS